MNLEDSVRSFCAINLKLTAAAILICVALVTAASTLVFGAGATPAPSRDAGLTAEQQQVVDTFTSMFAAIRAEDMSKLEAVVAPGFYIFDGGVRFDAQGLMAVIHAQHAMGKRYEWNVTEPDVRISGDTAWIAYVNKGSISDASGTKNQEWLESGFLHREGGSWKIVFVHSTRVPERAPQKVDWKSGEE
jgi:ketosteroid isomerase-like protein